LERYYEDFLTRTSAIASLDDERARVRLQLAEVSLASGNAEQAEQRLDEAISGWTGPLMDGEMKLRLGRDALLLALLKQEKDEDEAEAAFSIARAALEEVPQTEVDGQRLKQLVAILDFHEAKLLAANGEDAKALEQLLGATRALNELTDESPESAVLRSELAACYLSSATVLEGIGKLGDAREVRAQAAAEMVTLLKKNPEDMDLMLELAGCYGAMAESAVLSGDVGAASSLSEQAMELLDQISQKRPESTVAATRKAAQLGLQAGLLRDQGKSEEALEAFEEGIALLERQGANRRPMVDYRLALLWWQKGRMLGYSGKKDEELGLLGKAQDTLRDLEERADDSGPRSEELQRSRAYLLGDYAHALELAEKSEKAKEIFREAAILWEDLLKSRPQSEEYREGLEWIRQRAGGV
jgi:tetratricopeptide (TPR) repeat protein